MNSRQGLDLFKNTLSLEAEIHKGRTSTVYKCRTKDNKKTLVCVKCIRISQTDEPDKQRILLERLGSIVPDLHFSEKEGDNEFLVMQYMGPSLHDLFEEANRKFSMKTIALIGLKTIALLEQLHNQGYVHGRLTPKKILVDRDPSKDNLYLVGFSDAKRYKNEKGDHIKYKEHPQSTNLGNDFASLNAHMGIRLSRRDDIESLIYILLYFQTRAQIFEQKPKGSDHKDICKWKLETPVELIHPKASIELVQLLSHARSLKFDEKPNYEKIEKTLASLLHRELGKGEQAKYDWSVKSASTTTGTQVTDKRKVLHGLLQTEKVNKFPTILEDPGEYLETKVLDMHGEPTTAVLDREFNQMTFSPEIKPTYNSLQDTPKLESQQQPALRRVLNNRIGESSEHQSSPWNCSEQTDHLSPVTDKVKSLEFRTTVRLS